MKMFCDCKEYHLLGSGDERTYWNFCGKLCCALQSWAGSDFLCTHESDYLVWRIRGIRIRIRVLEHGVARRWICLRAESDWLPSDESKQRGTRLAAWIRLPVRVSCLHNMEEEKAIFLSQEPDLASLCLLPMKYSPLNIFLLGPNFFLGIV
ncbi:hypothetical protein E2C01_023302 [Portunus trituberculatus]|uniref:Uncharacterized protein n=1 Tax=Portunus trituberculatus TaxID=210409 RepID=A0A5B7E8G5_PORTR|nr:hypothetical protein [Portunus trituberculatus]